MVPQHETVGMRPRVAKISPGHSPERGQFPHCPWDAGRLHRAFESPEAPEPSARRARLGLRLKLALAAHLQFLQIQSAAPTLGMPLNGPWPYLSWKMPAGPEGEAGMQQKGDKCGEMPPSQVSGASRAQYTSASP